MARGWLCNIRGRKYSFTDRFGYAKGEIVYFKASITIRFQKF